MGPIDLASPEKWPFESRRWQEPWRDPPEDTLPSVVPLEHVLALNENVAVCLVRASVYRDGLELEIVTMLGSPNVGLNPRISGPYYGDDKPTGAPKLQLCFADGTEVNSQSFAVGGQESQGDDAQRQPVMHLTHGRGLRGHWQEIVWIWPLPPQGKITFLFEWPDAELSLTRWEMEAQIILDAAARAQVIFPRKQP